MTCKKQRDKKPEWEISILIFGHPDNVPTLTEIIIKPGFTQYLSDSDVLLGLKREGIHIF